MEPSRDPLLARWCKLGDTEALALLFDREAPRLLRLAVHWAGDAVEAEDLVQAAFLALIEARDTLDCSRPAGAWLAAVVAHKARDLRRKRAQAIDVERLHQRVAQDPAQPLFCRELSGELARAIDQLEPAQREVLLLRLRHGLSAAEIAHVLGQSPGTVRVRIFRALEKLRPLLPQSLALGLSISLSSPRGLAAIKSAVVSHAAALAPVPGTLVIGAWIVQQKLIAGAAALLAVVAWFAWTKLEGSATQRASTAEERETAALAQPENAAAAPLQLAESSVPSTERVSAGAAEPTQVAKYWKGRVIDGATGMPLAGVQISTHEPRRKSTTELLGTAPELYAMQADGTLHTRTQADWPEIALSSGPARFGREDLLVYDLPEAGTEPIESSTSAGDGTFALRAPPQRALLVCHLPGYASRHRVGDGEETTWEIALWPEVEVRGQIVLQTGAAPGVPIELVCYALRVPQLDLAQVDRVKPKPHAYAEHELEALGVWRTTAAPDGSFSLLACDAELFFGVLTPGWSFSMQPAFRPGAAAPRLVVEAMPSFRIRRESDQSPVTRVRLLCREQSSGYVVYAGEFAAPDGLLTLPGDSFYFKNRAEEPLRMQFWTEDLGPASVLLAASDQVGCKDVWLEAGTQPTLHGYVRSANEGLAAAEVALLGCGSALVWNEDETSLIDAVRSAADGGFELSAPPGKYILRVISGSAKFFEVVELPSGTPLVVDLSSSVRLAVTLVDEYGAPLANHRVALQLEDRSQRHCLSSSEGRALFEHLSSGRATIFVARQSGEDYSPMDQHSFELALGEQREERIVLPRERPPRYAFARRAGTNHYGSWRARNYAPPDWHALDADGRIPVDLNQVNYAIELESPEGERFSCMIPTNAPDGYELWLDGGDAAYEGVLLDADGRPKAGIRIWCNLWQQETPENTCRSALTDEQGRFHLRGLAKREHLLNICSNAGEEVFDRTLQTFSFLPNALPGDSRPLELRLPPVPELSRVHGTVRKGADGSPSSDIFLLFQCKIQSTHGTFILKCEQAIARTDSNGQFELELPRTLLRSVNIYTTWSKEGLALSQDLPDSGLPTEPALEFFLP